MRQFVLEIKNSNGWIRDFDPEWLEMFVEREHDDKAAAFAEGDRLKQVLGFDFRVVKIEIEEELVER